MLALPYLGSALGATTGYDTEDGDTNSRGALWIPLVGPFVVMGDTKSAGVDVVLALDGLAQIAGLTMLIYGLASPVVVLIPKVAAGPMTISVAPLAERGASGASLVGTF